MNNVSGDPYFFSVPQARSSLFGGEEVHHVFFAAVIGSIPDLSSYQEFENVDLLDQVQRVLEAQRLLLLGLAQRSIQQHARRALDLRYISQGQGRLTLALVGKGCSPDAGLARKEAEQLWLDSERLFPRHLYRAGLIPVTDPSHFRSIYEPFAEGQQIVAISKRIDQTSLLRLEGIHPIPYPLRWGISTMRDLCKTLVQMEQPCYISSALTPTLLDTTERRALNRVASRLKKLAEGRERSRRMGAVSSLLSGAGQASIQSQGNQQDKESFVPDPQAQINSELYESYLRNLDHPLLWRCYIVGQGVVPGSVVGAWYAEIIGSRPHQADTNQDQPASVAHLPAETLLIGTERSCALDNLRLVEFAQHQHDRGMYVQEGELAQNYCHLERLPRLVDVKEASCVFKLPCLPYRDEIGLTMTSGAFVTLAQPPLSPPFIELGDREDRTRHRVALHHLTRHTLVAGTTGSGKTTTCLNMLESLLRAPVPVPFLVIEPVNAEHNDYRALMDLERCPQVHLFTPGDEHTSQFRLNPFAIAPGITVSEHISLLLQCFKAALPMWEPLPRIFLKALNRVYYRAGWTITRKSGSTGNPPFPTMRDFYAEISQVVEHEIEHQGEVQGNIRGASKLRIEALLEGSCGRVLTARESLPARLWLDCPTIIELRHIGDDEDKALMSAFILLALREHCEHARPRQAGLQHVTLIEEAHRLLGQAPEGTSPEVASTKGQASAAFANMLAETRKYGEGLIIAEQLPTKLVPDVVGNTGLKIMHRLTAKEDREVLGRAMRFNQFQEDHVASLGLGQAAIYSPDQEEPVLVSISGKHWDERRNNAPSNNAVHERMRGIALDHQATFLPFTGCAGCSHPCSFRDHGEALASDKSLGYEAQMMQIFSLPDPSMTSEDVMRQVVQLSTTLARQSGVDGLQTDGIAYCMFLHLKSGSQLFRGYDGPHWETAFQRIQRKEA